MDDGYRNHRFTLYWKFAHWRIIIHWHETEDLYTGILVVVFDESKHGGWTTYRKCSCGYRKGTIVSHGDAHYMV